MQALIHPPGVHHGLCSTSWVCEIGSGFTLRSIIMQLHALKGSNRNVIVRPAGDQIITMSHTLTALLRNMKGMNRIWMRCGSKQDMKLS